MAPKQRPPPLHGDTFALLDLQDSVPGRRVFLRRLDDIAAAEAAKGDGRKVAIARAISERTTVRQDWIAKQLTLKSASNVSQRVRQYRLKPEGEKSKLERKWEKKWQSFWIL